MAEKWAVIAKFPIGQYEVSDMGNVRIVQRIGGSEIIQPVDVSSGWLYTVDGKRYGVNILVASSFLSNPHGYVAVRWKDGNNKNNCVKNLEWFELKSTSMPEIPALHDDVLQYAKNGDLIAEFTSVVEASKITRVNQAHIRKSLNGGRVSAGGFLWRWRSDGPPVELESRYSPVRQLSLTGELIAEFDTIDVAASQLGLVWQRIVKCCDGEMNNTGGYRWEYRDREVQKPAETVPKKKEPRVRQYMPNGLLMFEHGSIKSAARALSLDVEAIRSCCNREVRTVGDYIWRFSNDDEIKGTYEQAQKDEDGRRRAEAKKAKAEKSAESTDAPAEVPDIKPSAEGVADSSKSKPSAGETEVTTRKKRHSRRARSVRQYTKDGFFVSEYASVADATKAVSTSSGNISACCNRQPGHVSCKGFLWRYADDDEFKVESTSE